jgi:hypothetical protein
VFIALWCDFAAYLVHKPNAAAGMLPSESGHGLTTYGSRHNYSKFFRDVVAKSLGMQIWESVADLPYHYETAELHADGSSVFASSDESDRAKGQRLYELQRAALTDAERALKDAKTAKKTEEYRQAGHRYRPPSEVEPKNTVSYLKKAAMTLFPVNASADWKKWLFEAPAPGSDVTHEQPQGVYDYDAYDLAMAREDAENGLGEDPDAISARTRSQRRALTDNSAGSSAMHAAGSSAVHAAVDDDLEAIEQMDIEQATMRSLHDQDVALHEQEIAAQAHDRPRHAAATVVYTEHSDDDDD